MPPKKRGRKPKKTKEPKNEVKKVHKKRGRKPKGGKIIKNVNEKINQDEIKKPNIILQLKCSSKDLENHNENVFSNSKVNDEIKSYNLKNNKQTNINFEQYNNITYKPAPKQHNSSQENTSTNDNTDLKEIWEKLRILKLKLHLNEVSDKRSHCFWCTCHFDNPPIFIPKQERNNIIEVYGCFCSPECATAYLMEENIDQASKMERYALLNFIYGKLYNYEKNIKPAPNPYYILDKYYGNLSIQEYRKLLTTERLLLIVDKPLCRQLPELHEDNDDFLLNNKIGNTTSRYKIKKSQNIQTKSSIMQEQFNIM